MENQEGKAFFENNRNTQMLEGDRTIGSRESGDRNLPPAVPGKEASPQRREAIESSHLWPGKWSRLSAMMTGPP